MTNEEVIKGIANRIAYTRHNIPSDTEIVNWITGRKAELVVSSHAFGEYMSVRFDVYGRLFTISSRMEGHDYLRLLIAQAIAEEVAYRKQCEPWNTDG